MRAAKGGGTLIGAFESLLFELPGADLCIVDTPDIEGKGRSLTYCARPTTWASAGKSCCGGSGLRFRDSSVVRRCRCVEARAFGCPVITSRVGGIPSSVAHEVDGLLMPRKDPEALKAAILRVAANAELRARLVAGGLERARQCTVAASMADEVFNLLNRQAEDSVSHG